MTAISSLFGFLPLVLASVAGARGQVSLGTVVFGGLAVATVLSLFVVPVFYVVMKRLVAPPSPPPPARGLPEAPPGPVIHAPEAPSP
jgi:HAE1 family hydrophobic/amphiphilic exporter-1